MKDKSFIKADINDFFFSNNFNENNKINTLEKSLNSLESLKLSTQLIKDIKNKKENNTLSKNKVKENEIRIGNYIITKTLGKGTFGKVKLGIYLPRNKKVAIKIIEKRKIKEEDDIIRLRREFEMLSQFNHPNVITVSEIFESEDAYFTVMEFCEGGELFNYIVANKYLSEEKSAFFYYQLISGLEYIHSLGIVHRDLKPENLLLTHEHILKIIDFGLSNYFQNDQIELLETPCGSPCYASPEMLSGDNYDGFKIDIWASGIILFAMLCGYLPFDDKNNNILFQKILECKINFPKKLSNIAKDLLKRILVTNPKKRITIPEIKKHPFYLKGKEIFEKNFTIYQVNSDDIIDSGDSSFFLDFKNMKDNCILNNLIYYELNKNSEKIINKLNKDKLFKCKAPKKRSLSYELKNIKKLNEITYKDKSKKKTLKKLVNLEKRMKKMKNNKKDNKEKNKNKKKEELNNNKFIYDKEYTNIDKDDYIKYNQSITFNIKDINNFVENLIIKYKIEEELMKLNKKHNKKNKTEKIDNDLKIENNNKKNKSEDNNIRKNKYHKKIRTFNNNNKYKKTKEETNKKHFEIKDFLKTQPNNILFSKKIISPSRKSNFKTLNNKNIKVNIKKKETININNLFANRKNILPINNKLKKKKRETLSTSNNTSKKKNFKNILKEIKEQSFKNNINLTNKKKVIHHHITNITNMTQKNYFSNVIINNFKGKEDNKNNSTSKNKTKFLVEIPILKINKNINLKPKFNQIKKQSYKNSKLKNNLQKLILKDDNILKSSIKLKSKTIININDDEIKNQKKINKNKNIKTQKKSKSKSKEKEVGSKTIQISNNNQKKQYQIKVSFINNKRYNINNKNKNIYLNTENSIRNTSIKKDKDKELNKKNHMYNDKKIKMFLTDTNLDEEVSKSKLNYIATNENSYSNRSNKKTILNSLDKNKINRHWNPFGIPKIENIKKSNLKNKKLSFFQKFPILNIKDIIRKNNITIKNNTNYKWQKQINSQRNKVNDINNNKKLSTYHYLNSARINDKKIINNSYNIGNNQGLGYLTENNIFFNNKVIKLCKIKTSQNNVRNKNLLNNDNYKNLNNNIISNITNDYIKLNSSKNKSLFNSNNELNSLINNKNVNNKNYNDKNIYFDKYLVSKKLLASLRKRTNLKSMLINNIFDKKINNKTQKNSKNKNKGYEKKKINNNSVIINFPNNVKQMKFNNNTISDNKKVGIKNNYFKNNEFLRFKTELYNSLHLEAKHKKIKSMKETFFDIKIKKASKKLSNPLLNK